MTGEPIIFQSTEANARAAKLRVSEDHGVTIEEIDGDNRTLPVLTARLEAIAEVRRVCPKWSIARIGRFFGRDHTTILNALKTIRSDIYVRRLMLIHEDAHRVAEITGRTVDEVEFIANSDALRQAVLAGREQYRDKLRWQARKARRVA